MLLNIPGGDEADVDPPDDEPPDDDPFRCEPL